MLISFKFQVMVRLVHSERFLAGVENIRAVDCFQPTKGISATWEKDDTNLFFEWISRGRLYGQLGLPQGDYKLTNKFHLVSYLQKKIGFMPFPKNQMLFFS